MCSTRELSHQEFLEAQLVHNCMWKPGLYLEDGKKQSDYNLQRGRKLYTPGSWFRRGANIC